MDSVEGGLGTDWDEIIKVCTFQRVNQNLYIQKILEMKPDIPRNMYRPQHLSKNSRSLNNVNDCIGFD